MARLSSSLKFWNMTAAVCGSSCVKMTSGLALMICCTWVRYDVWPGATVILETIVLPNFSHVALMGVGMVCWAMSDEKRRAAVLYPFWWAYRAMATPSWESEGLERQRYWLAFLSNAVLPPWNSVGILAALTIGDTAAIS